MTSRFSAAIDERGTSPIDTLLSAPIDAEWIRKKSRIEFNREIMRKLSKAVYGVGRRGRQWFSAGSELSGQEAARLLDYAILVELLVRHRHDLDDYESELRDCREQLRMQIDRYTERQPERVAEHIEAVVRHLES